MLLKLILQCLLVIFIKIFSVQCKTKGSVAFVIDTSGSMTWAIEAVKNGASDILTILHSETARLVNDIVLETYNDDAITMKIKTNNSAKFRNALSAVHIHDAWYNYDCQEITLNATEKALEYVAPDSHIYVFTDAATKYLFKTQAIIDISQKMQTQITFIISLTEVNRNCRPVYKQEFKVYFDIAWATSGNVYLLQPSEISLAVKDLKETVKDNQVVLTSILTKANTYTDVPFKIDEYIEYVTISTSGENVDLKIRNPQNQEFKIKKSNKLLWTAHVKKIKIPHPTQGRYVLTVKGSIQTTVIIFGRSDFTFEYGFSILVPTSMADTSKKPVGDTDNYLSILVTDPKNLVDVKNVEILNMNEQILQTMDLEKFGENFYVTRLRISKIQFKIAVTGNIKLTGDEIRRISKTPIYPTELPVNSVPYKSPEVVIREAPVATVEYGKSITISCSVNAYPKPNITWTDLDGNVLSSQESLVESPYKYVSQLTVKDVKSELKYKCSASNGLTLRAIDKDVIVKYKELFTVKETPKAQIRVEYNNSVTLNCDITSYLPMYISWFHGKLVKNPNKYSISKDGRNLKFIASDLDVTGKYSCIAYLTNITELKNKERHLQFDTEVKIKGLRTPRIIMKPIMIMKFNTLGVIDCKIVDGNPKPTISWYFKRAGSSKFLALKQNSEKLYINKNLIPANAGHYKCIALNIVGKDEKITRLFIEAPPHIDVNETDFLGIEGDIALRIPCKASGYPTNTITWFLNGRAINTDEKYSVDGDTLVIKDLKIKDSNNYTCTAQNKMGTDTKTFIINVSTFLTDFGQDKNIYMLKGESKNISCAISTNKNESVKWFKNGEYMSSGLYLSLNNVTTWDDSNYTCRVSNLNGSQIHTLVLDVGFAPTFTDNPMTDIEWYGQDYELACYTTGKPVDQIVWTHNGKKLILENDSKLKITDGGQYTCKISNVHGSVERTYNVNAKACLIDTKVSTLNMPLLLNESSSWPTFETSNEFIIVPEKTKIVLACPGHITTPNYFRTDKTKTIIEARCEKVRSFLVDGKSYKFEDFKCKENVMPTITKKRMKCYKNDSETYSVGFTVNNKFIEAYEVCFDTKNNYPIYTRVLTTPMNYLMAKQGLKWFQHENLPHKSVTYNASSKSCDYYKKHQLVSIDDVFYGPAQNTTFIEQLNAVPVYTPCGPNRNVAWETIEKSIRHLFYDSKLMIWSGTASRDRYGIPQYLWKVIHEVDEDPIVVIYNNGLTEKPKLCNGDCNVLSLYQLEDEFTYCCKFNDFATAFGFLPEQFTF